MLKALTALFSAGALCLALPAHAASNAPLTTTLNQSALQDDAVVAVEARPNPAGTIIGDAIGGAVIGGAVGGGVALYNRYGTNNGNGDWGNWQRDILVGAGIGLGVGLIVGGISAASNASDHSYMAPATEHRDTGFSSPVYSYGARF
jgi:hypothetical protein